MKLLFDENLPRRLADALATLGLPVDHVEMHGLRTTPDVDIFAYCAQHDFVLVSADLRIHRDKTELAALNESGIGVIEVDLGNMKLFDQAKHFLDRAEDLAAILSEHPPFHFKMTSRGFRSALQNQRRRRKH